MFFDKIKLVYKPSSEKAQKIIEKLQPALKKYQCVEVEHQKNLELHVEPDELILSVGGDGTLISIMRNLNNPKMYPINICGINAGNRGFLCSFEPDSVDIFNKLILAKEFPFRKRKRFLTTVRRQKSSWSKYFVNETTISANRIARLQEFAVHYGDVFLDQYLADGIIVSSPQGSTAYNLAAGGAIVHHELEAYSITPICPHKLTHRSLVLPDYRDVSVTLMGEQSGLVTLDGQETKEIETGDRVSIVQSPEVIYVFRNPNEKYVERIRSKLLTTDRDI